MASVGNHPNVVSLIGACSEDGESTRAIYQILALVWPETLARSRRLSWTLERFHRILTLIFLRGVKSFLSFRPGRA